MQTNDYDVFDTFNSNRPVSESSVKKIMESIQKIGYIEANPIIVNKDFLIIDGQHRYEACKRLNLPIFYEEVDIDADLAMIQLNASQKSWKLMDYVHAHACKGIECYVELEKFSEKHKLGQTNSLNILLKAYGSSGKIRTGKNFPVNANAEKIVSFILQCYEYLHFAKSTDFVVAVTVMFDRINDESISRILKDLMTFKQQATVNDYLLMFENIHNRSVRLLSKRISLKI